MEKIDLDVKRIREDKVFPNPFYSIYRYLKKEIALSMLFELMTKLKIGSTPA